MTRRLRVGALVLVLTLFAAWFPPRVSLAAPAARSAILPVALTPAGGAGVAAASTAGALPFATSHLALRWRGAADPTIELRWHPQGGSWSPWTAVEHDQDMTDRVHGWEYSSLLIVREAAAIEARVVSGPVGELQAVAIDAVHATRRAVGVSAAAPAAAAALNTAARIPPPAIVTRAEWGADETIRKGTPAFAPISKLIVHHTADDTVGTTDFKATIRAIYEYHVTVRGWSDIGYNFLVDPNGVIYEGRYARPYAPGEYPTGEDLTGRGVIGAHAEGFNTGSVGVSLLGNFEGEQPTRAALDALESLLAWKADRQNVDVMVSSPYTKVDGTVVTTPNLAGHRDTKATACPGANLYSRLPCIRQDVSARVRSAYGETKGYWEALSDGRVAPFGEAVSYGSMAGSRLNGPIMGITATSTGKGYWLLGSDGGIFSFGDAAFHGSTGGLRLNKPVVGMAATPAGGGYWLVASDGGIFAFGDAGFYGSMGGIPLNKPVVGMAPTASGHGYWLVASDGGIFAFGDAAFHGSTGAMTLNQPVVGMTPIPDGSGYWLVARDGGVFAFDAPFVGSIPGLCTRPTVTITSLRGTNTGRGYYMLAADGGVFAFGDAKFLGAASAAPATARDLAVLNPPRS